MGYPGTGKSYTAARECAENSDATAVAMTSPAVSNLIQQGIPKQRVLSFEKASMGKVRTGTLYVDEATQLTWYDLALIVSPAVTKLRIMGDKVQIGKVDFDGSWGRRGISGLHEHCANITNLTETRRFGGQLLQELQTRLTDMTAHVDGQGNGPPDTHVSVDVTRKFSAQHLLSAVDRDRPSLLLCFTRSAQSKVEAALAKS